MKFADAYPLLKKCEQLDPEGVLPPYTMRVLRTVTGIPESDPLICSREYMLCRCTLKSSARGHLHPCPHRKSGSGRKQTVASGHCRPSTRPIPPICLPPTA